MSMSQDELREALGGIVVLTPTKNAWSDELRRRDLGLSIVELDSGAEVPEGRRVFFTGSVVAQPEDLDATIRSVDWVHFWSAGIDRFPREPLAGRLVTASRGVTSDFMAEYCLAMALADEKRLPDLWHASAASVYASPLGTLDGRVVGLLGFGEVGKATARRLLAFGSRVVAYRRSGRSSEVPGVEMLASLEELLSIVDHLVVVAALTEETRHMLDRSAFESVKPGVHLINVGRGAIVDHDALLEALDSGAVRRASLDVTEPEPLPEGHPLLSHPRAFITNHISFSGPAVPTRLIDFFVANLLRFSAGEALLSPVDLQVGY